MRGQRRPAVDAGLSFENYRIGQTVHSEDFELSAELVARFLDITKLSNPLYTDDGHGQRLGHRERLVPEFLVLAVAQSLLEAPDVLGDSVIALSSLDDVTFVKPVYIGDILHVEVRVEELRLVNEKEDGRGQVALRFAVLTRSNNLVARGVLRALVTSNEPVTTL